MIDMRTDSGEVQPDGFEYNYFFRTKGWKPTPGHFTFVRRRRWLRLMVRSSQPTFSDPSSGRPMLPNKRDKDIVYPEISDNGCPEHPEWGTDVERNWANCHRILKCAGTDGRMLEMWTNWLGLTSDGQLTGRVNKQWTEEDGPFPSQPRFNEPSIDPLNSAVQHAVAMLQAQVGDASLYHSRLTFN
jgi:hypothetical protein